LANAQWVNIDAVDAAAIRAQKLHSELSDEPEADYYRYLAECGLRHTQALKGDRANRRESGMLQGDAFRDACDEILGNGDKFGVVCVAGACASDPVLWRELGHILADHFDHACT
jgi:hypothetical protein